MKKFISGIGVLVLVIALLLLFRKNNRISHEAAVAQFSNEHSNFWKWEGINLHYTDQGEGVPILMVHGFGGSFDNWRKLIHAFPEGYRLIAADLPGFGLSQHHENLDPSVQLVDYYTHFTTDLLEEIGLDSCFIIGNSLGGYLSWETALQHPDKVKKMVLLNSAGYSAEDVKAFLVQVTRTGLFAKITKKGVPKFMTKYAAKRVMGDKSHKPDPQRLESFYGLINKEGTMESIQRIGMADHFIDTTKIRNICIPTLVVWGDEDGIVPVDHAYKFDRDLPDSKLLIYEGSGHVPMIENTQRLMHDILMFFDDYENAHAHIEQQAGL